MSKFELPSTGLHIQHDRSESKHSPQIIRLNLSDKDAHDLLKFAKDNQSCYVKLGKKPAITFGTKHVSLHHGTDRFPQEVFSGPLNGSKPAYFAGKSSHTLEVQQAHQATAGVDQALAALKNNLKSTHDERVGTEGDFRGSSLLKPGHRPSSLSGGLLGSRPSSPFLSAGFSPRSGPTSAPSLQGPAKEDRIKLEAIKIPVIHLLAVEPQDANTLKDKLRVKRSDLDKVLFKVAREEKGGKKELKDRSFRDLDVWKFPYHSQNDRQSAIDRAVSAFDRLRIEKSDSLWQMLLAKEDRGKGFSLSKLNFDKPLMTGNLTPRLPERSTDGGSTEGRSMASDNSNNKGKAPISKAADTTNKPKSIESKINAAVPKSVSASKAAAVAASKETKRKTTPKPEVSSGKFKSSDRIEDSDEEADAGPSVPAAPSTRRQEFKDAKSVTKPARTEKVVASSSKSAQKPHLPAPHTKDQDPGRLTPSSAMARTRSGIDTQKSSNATNVRPRNGSSPVKPSPLGSSPPTNSLDVDTSSNSSKATSHSSTASSPPSSTDLSQSKKKNYSPVVGDKKPERLVNGTKRKADADNEGPHRKKAQVDKNPESKAEKFNSLPKPLADKADRQPPSKRETPDSDVSSASEGPIRARVIDEARKFKRFYTKYKDLHDKLNEQKVVDRDEAELDKVWNMHQRLKTMKDQIWSDWTKVEKMEAHAKS